MKSRILLITVQSSSQKTRDFRYLSRGVIGGAIPLEKGASHGPSPVASLRQWISHFKLNNRSREIHLKPIIS